MLHKDNRNYWCVDCAKYKENPNKCRSVRHSLIELRKKSVPPFIRFLFGSLLIFLFVFPAQAYAQYQSVIPTLDTDHVKATSDQSGNYPAWRSANPNNSLTGGIGEQWIADGFQLQRFHIDLGSARIIKRIYLENSHDSGADTYTGIRNFTFWGSNDVDAFNDTAYGSNDGWTQLITDPMIWQRHIESASADPQYADVTNTTAYRYYAMKISDSYRYDYFMGFRRIELQELTGSPTPTPTTTPIPTPTPTPQPPHFNEWSLIYYKLYTQNMGICNIYTACSTDLFMTVYNNTDEWRVEQIDFKNVGSPVQKPFIVEPGRIETMEPYIYYYRSGTPRDLYAELTDVTFHVRNIYTDEIQYIPAPGQGVYQLEDPSTAGGLTELDNSSPDTATSSGSLPGYCKPLSFHVPVIDWDFTFPNWACEIFGVDPSILSKYDELREIANEKIPFGYINAFSTMNLDHDALASANEFPDFTLPAINLIISGDEVEMFPETTLDTSTWDQLETARSTTRTALDVIITGGSLLGLVIIIHEFFTHFV